MKYQQLRGQVRQLWMDHAGGVPLTPVSVKTWVQGRVSDALLEYTDTNAAQVAGHIAYDLHLSPVQTTQMVDWLMFARDCGFATKKEEQKTS